MFSVGKVVHLAVCNMLLVITLHFQVLSVQLHARYSKFVFRLVM